MTIVIKFTEVKNNVEIDNAKFNKPSGTEKDRGWRIGDRVMRNRAILDPRSSILDPRSLYLRSCGTP